MARLRQRPAAWLAIFAMLLGALAPTISRATVPGGGRLFVDLCTTAGAGFAGIERARATRSGDAASDQDGEGRQPQHSLDRCPYCGSHAGVAIAPPPAAGPLLASPGSARLPSPSPVSPRPQQAWSPSHPRAPPLRA